MCYIIVFLYWYDSSSWGTYPRSPLPQLFPLKFINHTHIVYVYAILCCKHCLYWVYITIYYEFSLLHIFSLVIQFIEEKNICFVHTTVLSLKTAFNLVKIHLLFRIMINSCRRHKTVQVQHHLFKWEPIHMFHRRLRTSLTFWM
jgi:hypothetical protein